jgi:hypothetical protein
MARILRKLMAFLSPQEAQETAARIYCLAQETDEEISAILKDPLVRSLYDYDGRFFTARRIRLFHTAFDGPHLLESLSDSNLELFFLGKDKRGGIRRLLEDVEKHARLAWARRMNWEDFQTLGLLPPDVLNEILEGARERMEAEPPQPSAEELIFFQSFEEQMESSFRDSR